MDDKLLQEVQELINKLIVGDLETKDWILVYKPGLTELVMNYAKAQKEILILKGEM